MENFDIDSYVNNIKTILPLANCHLVNFITENMFVKLLPECIQEEIMTMSVEELNNMVINRYRSNSTHNTPYKQQSFITLDLDSFLDNTSKLYLKQNQCLYSVEALCRKLESKGFSEVYFQQFIKHLMSEKKSHEVEMMSGIIAAMTKAKNCSHIADIGGGKGYLSAILALNHQLKVLSIDSSEVTSKGAAKQIPKVEKLFAAHHKSKFETSDFKMSSKNEECSQRCKLATTYVSENTNLLHMITEHFQEDEVRNVMLVGLHTCGNLAASSLRLFVNHPDHLRCLINVGCCYNLLVEEYDPNPLWLQDESHRSGCGFPMSLRLKNLRFFLGRNARMLAAQSQDRLVHAGTIETESLFYRALLQLYLKMKLGSLENFPQLKVGKSKKKCSNFVEYAKRSIKCLDLDITVDDKELQQLYDDHQSSKKQFHAFFLLRLAVAPAIEAVIMLDRLLYLFEQGVEAYLTQLFDPVVSPRCYAIIAVNKSDNGD